MNIGVKWKYELKNCIRVFVIVITRFSMYEKFAISKSTSGTKYYTNQFWNVKMASVLDKLIGKDNVVR